MKSYVEWKSAHSCRVCFKTPKMQLELMENSMFAAFSAIIGLRANRVGLLI